MSVSAKPFILRPAGHLSAQCDRIGRFVTTWATFELLQIGSLLESLSFLFVGLDKETRVAQSFFAFVTFRPFFCEYWATFQSQRLVTLGTSFAKYFTNFFSLFNDDYQKRNDNTNTHKDVSFNFSIVLLLEILTRTCGLAAMLPSFPVFLIRLDCVIV